MLDPEASEALRISVRAAHLGRYTLPRSEFPAGRSGYLRWRQRLYREQAERLHALLGSVGAPEVVRDRARDLVSKRLLDHKTDLDATLVEDTLALTFFEFDALELADRLDPTRLARAVDKTVAKMSSQAVDLLRAQAMAGRFPGAVAALLASSVNRGRL